MKYIATAIIAASLICNAVKAQKLTPVLVFNQGDTIRVTSSLKNNVSQDAMGQLIEFTLKGQTVHYYRVSNTTAENTSLHHQMQQLEFKFDGMGQKLTYSSVNPKDQKNPIAPSVQEVLGKSYDMIIDASGKNRVARPEKIDPPVVDDRMMIINNMIKDLTEPAYPPAANASTFFSILPAKELSVGDIWSDAVTKGTDKITNDYTLRSVTDSVITVDFKSKVTNNSKSTIMGQSATTATTADLSGTILLDRKTGIMKRRTTQGDVKGSIEMMSTSMPLSARIDMITEVEVIKAN